VNKVITDPDLFPTKFRMTHWSTNA